jgi:L-alanine-DL-glutamate epimerase-like enolase superfamily enzyme
LQRVQKPQNLRGLTTQRRDGDAAEHHRCAVTCLMTLPISLIAWVALCCRFSAM